MCLERRQQAEARWRKIIKEWEWSSLIPVVLPGPWDFGRIISLLAQEILPPVRTRTESVVDTQVCAGAVAEFGNLPCEGTLRVAVCKSFSLRLSGHSICILISSGNEPACKPNSLPRSEKLFHSVKSMLAPKKHGNI